MFVGVDGRDVEKPERPRFRVRGQSLLHARRTAKSPRDTMRNDSVAAGHLLDRSRHAIARVLIEKDGAAGVADGRLLAEAEKQKLQQHRGCAVESRLREVER